MNKIIKIALASLNSVWEDKGANRIKVESILRNANAESTDLVIFPEMTLTGYSLNTNAIAEQQDFSESIEFFKKQTKKYMTSIVFGLALKRADGITNSAVWVNANGIVLNIYDKIHPFSFAGEDNFFLSGNKLSVTSDFGVSFGLSICYDLRFPEIYSCLGMHSEILINIANWPKKRVDHWNALLMARAIENQIVMIGVNRTGEDPNGNLYEKSTAVFDPNGVLISPIKKSGCVDYYLIDLADINSIKRGFSTTQDRKPEIYAAFLTSRDRK